MSSQTDQAAHPRSDAVSAETKGPIVPATRIVACSIAALGLSFILSTFLTHWLDWPGVSASFAFLGLIEGDAGEVGPDGFDLLLSLGQLALYLGPIAAIACFVRSTPRRDMDLDAAALTGVTDFIIRGAFWSVMLIGAVDAAISFLRVEGLLAGLVGEALAENLGRPNYRGVFVHYPLVAISYAIAFRTRSIGFIWLALLIVVAEIQIVIARFIFSYEQAFMGDLVRFWYGALFLFASPYTLVKEGHVRVDILYSGFTARGKAWANAVGCMVLGLPLCATILGLGLWGRSNTITGPMLNHEVTQSGYGMYVKYLLASFLLVFAISMLVQFMGYFLSSVAVLLGKKPPGEMGDAHGLGH